MSANLIIQTAFLGDLLLSIPLLKQVKKNWPDQELLLVCRKGFGEFFLKTGLVDRVFEVVKKDSASYAAALQKISTYQIAHLLAPHESWRTVLFCHRIKAQKKITYRKFLKGFFFDELIERDQHLPDALRQLSLLSKQDKDLQKNLAEYLMTATPFVPAADGRLSAPPPWASMSLREVLLADQEGFQRLCHKLNEALLNKFVLLFPGSVWATKRWTSEGYVQTGCELQKQGYQVIVMGGPGEEALSQQVAAKIPGSLCLAGQTSIYESALLMARSCLVIGNDSASTHLASVGDVPVIAVFGPTVLEFGFRPWSAQAYVAEKRDLYCRPCGMHGHQKCPLGTHDCMRQVGASEVLSKAMRALRK